MNCNQWIFDMDGTLTDSMTAVWENAPLALLRRYGRTPRADLRSTLLSMGMADGAQYLIREYALPLRPEDYFGVMRSVIAELYETVELKPGVRELLARLKAEGARMCICSNTWSDQCKAVLTRLGVDDCFEFYIEAHDAGFYVVGIADAASAADEPALRRVSDQFLTRWAELKF